MDYDKHLFAIWGPPGGGKTTLAANLAVVLADSGYMTCLVSASDHGELQAFYGTAIPKGKGLYAAYSSGRNVREALTQARPNLCLLELDTGGDAYDIANITTEQITNMMEDLRDQFTYVIIDCTSYKESAFTGIGLVEADKVVVCIPHRVSAATWHIANHQMLDAIRAKTFFVDCNTREGGCEMAQLLDVIGLPECDIKLGLVDDAYRWENEGKPIVLHTGKRERLYKKAVLKLIQSLLNIESEERSKTKKNRRDRKKKEAAGEDSMPQQQINNERMVRPEQRSVHVNMSESDRRRMEEDAIRRAQDAAVEANAPWNQQPPQPQQAPYPPQQLGYPPQPNYQGWQDDPNNPPSGTGGMNDY